MGCERMSRFRGVAGNRSGRAIGFTGLFALLASALAVMGSGARPGLAASTAPTVSASMARLPVTFIENRGQTDSAVRYYAPGNRDRVFFGDSEITLSVGAEAESTNPSTPGQARAWTLKLAFPGSQVVRPIGSESSGAVVNYFKGERDDWKLGIRTFHRVTYPALWNGINLVYTGHPGKMKQEFHVAPGADPTQIRQAYSGSDDLRVLPSGDLVIRTPVGDVTDLRPYAYQQVEGRRMAVACEFEILPSRQIAFRLGEYDPRLELVIDPAFYLYSGFLGGAGDDKCTDVASDIDGNAYIVGETNSSDTNFPKVSGPDLTFNGTTDAFVAKLRPDASSYIYCGYIGGEAADSAKAVTVDGSADVYVVGNTDGSGFPTTASSFDSTYAGGTDGFLTKINVDGTTVLFSGFLGGTGAEESLGVTVDSSKDVYVVGTTSSAETFPTSGGPDLSFNGGTSDGFISKIKNDGSGFDYSGYIGGNLVDTAVAVRVNATGIAVVLGSTTTSDSTFPVTSGVVQTNHGGAIDCYVASVAANGANLTACTYFGGANDDKPGRLEIDTGGIYLCGGTASPESSFRVTEGAFDVTHNGRFDGFVTRINASLTSLLYSTYFGGTQDDAVADIGVDPLGTAFITGVTGSDGTAGFPTAGGPDLTYNGGASDAFVARLNAAGSQMLYSGYIGGSGADQGLGNAVDGSANQIACGSVDAGGEGFITFRGPDSSFNGGVDGFVVKVVDSGATAVRLSAFQVVNSGEGAVIAWRTSGETNHVGFRVWREEPGGRQPVAERLIPGTAFLASTDTGVAGRSYSVVDPEPGRAYTLEAIDLAGNSQLLGPITPDPTVARPPAPDLSAAEEAARATQREAEPAEGSLRRWAASALVAPGAGTAAARPGTAPADLAALPGAQIEIAEEGWVRVSGAELAAAGLTDVESRRLRMFAGGEEVAFRVVDGGDRRFQAGDSIEFYGVGLDTPWTDRRVYWLTASAGVRSPAFTLTTPRPGPARTAGGSFPDAVERQDRSLYFAALQNGDAPNLFGAIIAPGNVTPQPITLNDPDLSPGGGGLVEIDLQGVSDPAGEGDHRVQVTLNGTPLGQVAFDGREEGLAAFPVGPSLLRDGVNDLHLSAEGGPADISLVDTVRIQYRRLFKASGDLLRFRTTGGASYSVDGFSTGGVTVVDVTDPERPVVLPGRVSPTAEGFRVSGVAPGRRNQPRLLLAFGPGQVRAAAAVTANTPSSLKSRTNGADFLIIGPGELLPSAEPRAAARRAAGLDVLLVNIRDIYDEIAGGEKSPYALREFLTRTVKGWRTAPRYALLLGDASVDPRGLLGLNVSDLVPTLPIPTESLEAPGDDRLADGNNDGIPDLAIGRLPAAGAAEATLMISKSLAREAAVRSGGDWTHSALLLADGRDDYDFAGQSVLIHAPLPKSIVRTGVLWTTQQPSGLAATALQQGSLTAAYFGHGSVSSWAGSFLTSGQARTLTNGSKLPILLGLTCLNGLFTDPYEESLGESLLRAPQGGAAVLWLSGALTQPGQQAVMGRRFLAELAAGRRVGDAVRTAKLEVGDGDVRRSWVLLGDPTTTLQ